MEDQEKSYTVNDKRQVNAQDPVEAQDMEPEVDSAAAEDIESEAKPEGDDSDYQMPEFDVYMILGFTVSSLAEKAWETMGLRLAPGSKELKQDLVQAKLAVDTITFLVEKLIPHMSEEEAKAMRAVVSDLQINFVRQNT